MKTDVGRLAAIALAIIVMGMLTGFGALTGFAYRTEAARQGIAQNIEAHCDGTEADCAQKDLRAQVRAASAAEAMVGLTFWQVYIGGLGLVVGGITMAAAIAAAKYAADAATHTENAAQISREALEDSRKAASEEAKRYADQLAAAKVSTDIAVATQRPWLKMRLDRVDVFFEDYGEPLAGVTARVTIENVGKSPAVLERMVEIDPDLSRNNPAGTAFASRRAADSVKHHFPGNVMSPRTIFPGDTEEFGNARVGMLKPTPFFEELGTGKISPPYPDEPGYVLIVGLGITYKLPGGGEGHTRRCYMLKNPDGSLLVPFAGTRSDFDMEPIDYVSYAD